MLLVDPAGGTKVREEKREEVAWCQRERTKVMRSAPAPGDMIVKASGSFKSNTYRSFPKEGHEIEASRRIDRDLVGAQRRLLQQVRDEVFVFRDGRYEGGRGAIERRKQALKCRSLRHH
jgi:hypothetical protein